MKKTKHYTLFTLDDGGESIQRLLMTPLGRSCYRVEETAVSETPIFYHDIIEASHRLGRGLRFRRVVERSGLRVYRFLCSQDLIEAEPVQALQRRVLEHGGYWETLFGGILIIHLPRGSACRPKSELRAIARSLPSTSVEN